jgi:predicted Zn-dependent peptidase
MDISGEELTKYIHNLSNYNHKVFYSGPLSLAELDKTLSKVHTVPSKFLPTPPLKEFEMKDTDGKSVYLAHYDMVQAEIMWLKKSSELDITESADVDMFNEYFGGGMSSIVFQEIREAKALAYSTYSFYSEASKLGENNVVLAYVGTQSDKMKEGIEAMNVLLADLPEDQKTFENGKQALKQNLETSRILKTAILFNYDQALKLGVKEDMRKRTSDRLQSISLTDVVTFHQNKIAGDFTYIVLGDRNKIDLEYLKKYGDVKELSLEKLFGY